MWFWVITVIALAVAVFGYDLIHRFERYLTYATVAALALLPTIGNSLSAAVRGAEHREAAMFTFVITLSGVTIAKIGSPFWGVLAGVLAMMIASVRSSR